MNYEISSQPQGETYRALLRWAGARSSEFQFVLRSSLKLGPRARALLDDLLPFEANRSMCSEWPGTVLVGDIAEVRSYAVRDEVIALVSTAASGLYDWLQPDLPEDLCFLRDDRTPLLWTICHERAAYISLAPSERDDLLQHVPSMRLEATSAN